MPIRHTLWVFFLAGRGRLTGSQTQNIDEVMSNLNNLFMKPLISDLSDSAVASLVPDGTTSVNFTAGDAVVFIISNFNKSLLAKVYGSNRPGSKVTGLTVFGKGIRSISEVYWERCLSSLEVANSVFHEAAHGMSQQGDRMHHYFIHGIGGGSVRVLNAHIHGSFLPSWGDLDFYAKAIDQGTRFYSSIPPN